MKKTRNLMFALAVTALALTLFLPGFSPFSKRAEAAWQDDFGDLAGVRAAAESRSNYYENLPSGKVDRYLYTKITVKFTEFINAGGFGGLNIKFFKGDDNNAKARFTEAWGGSGKITYIVIVRNGAADDIAPDQKIQLAVDTLYTFEILAKNGDVSIWISDESNTYSIIENKDIPGDNHDGEILFDESAGRIYAKEQKFLDESGLTPTTLGTTRAAVEGRMNYYGNLPSGEVDRYLYTKIAVKFTAWTAPGYENNGGAKITFFKSGGGSSASVQFYRHAHDSGDGNNKAVGFVDGALTYAPNQGIDLELNTLYTFEILAKKGEVNVWLNENLIFNNLNIAGGDHDFEIAYPDAAGRIYVKEQKFLNESGLTPTALDAARAAVASHADFYGNLPAGLAGQYLYTKVAVTFATFTSGYEDNGGVKIAFFKGSNNNAAAQFARYGWNGKTYIHITRGGSVGDIAPDQPISFELGDVCTIEILAKSGDASIWLNGVPVIKNADIKGDDHDCGIEFKDSTGNIVVSEQKFINEIYTVTYDPGADGAEGAASDIKVTGTPLTLRGVLFTRAGYTQTGWSTTDGQAKVYELEDSYTADAGTTLYPFWTIKTYTVSFDLNTSTYTNVISATGKPENQTINHGAKASQPGTAPTSANYLFDGWDKEAACANAWVFGTEIVTGPATIYAKWTIETFTVSFDLNTAAYTSVTGAAGKPSDQTIDHGAKASQPGTAPTSANYDFAGWYKETACVNAWVFGTDTVTEAATIYAKWTIKAFTVSLTAGEVYTLKAKTGSQSPVNYGGSFAFTFSLAAAYSKSAAVIKVNGEPVTLTDGEYTIANITANTTVTVENVTLNTYAVTFKADGETVATKSVAHGGTLTDIPSVPAKDGYDAAWDKTDFANVTGDITVNAVYTEIPVETKPGSDCGKASGAFSALIGLLGAALIIVKKRRA